MNRLRVTVTIPASEINLIIQNVKNVLKDFEEWTDYSL